MYLQNKYTKWYYSITSRAQTRVSEAGIILEKHHIIPESFFISSKRSKKGWIEGNPNDPKNLVKLTIREHRLCHLLLLKMTNGIALEKMTQAARLMIDRSFKNHGMSNGLMYEKIRIDAFAKMVATRKQNGSYERSNESISRQIASRKAGNYKHSEETIAKMLASREANSSRFTSPESIARGLATRLAKSPEEKAQIKQRQKDAIAARTIEQKSERTKKFIESYNSYYNNLSEADKQIIKDKKKSANANLSPAQKEKRSMKASAARKGKPKQKITCPHCNKSIGGESNFSQWHGDNCKMKK